LSTSDIAIGPRPGLSNVADIIIAPGAAFARLREVPTWGWAFLAASLLGVAGSLLATPAIMHGLAVSMPAILGADPNIAKLPPDQQQKQIATVINVTSATLKFAWILVPVVLLCIALLQALAMTLANAVARGDGGFRKYFALSMNVAVVGLGLNSLAVGAIAVIRGPNAFDAASAVQAAVPSVALLAPGLHGFWLGFLGTINVFYLWATALLAMGMAVVGRIPRAGAWITAIVLLLAAAAYFGFGARNG
jgi:hypothetical protein